MVAELPAARDLASRLGGSSPHDRVLLRFYDCRLTLSSNSSTLIERLRAYYEGYVDAGGEPDIEISAFEADPLELPFSLYDNPPDQGKKKVKEEYRDLADGRVVRKKQTGMVFIFGEGVNTVIGPCLRYDNQVINFINNRYIQWMLDRGYMLIHAAGVAQAGTGIALAGTAGSGKSTLALTLMERGMSFVSNDRLLVRRNGDDLQMAGIPKMPRINPGTAAGSPRLKTILTDEDRNLCERLSMEELWEYERKYDVMVAELFGEDRLVIAPVHMRGLVILNWKRITGEVRFKEVDIRRRIDLMEAFMKNPGIFYRSPGRGSRGEHSRERYLECLGNCPVYELYGEVDFVGAAAACIGLMETNTAYGPKG